MAPVPRKREGKYEEKKSSGLQTAAFNPDDRSDKAMYLLVRYTAELHLSNHMGRSEPQSRTVFRRNVEGIAALRLPAFDRRGETGGNSVEQPEISRPNTIAKCRAPIQPKLDDIGFKLDKGEKAFRFGGQQILDAARRRKDGLGQAQQCPFYVVEDRVYQVFVSRKVDVCGRVGDLGFTGDVGMTHASQAVFRRDPNGAGDQQLSPLVGFHTPRARPASG